MKEVTFRLTSTTPLLMHNVNSMLVEKPATVTHAVWEKSPEVFRARMYLQGDSIVLPPRVIKAVLTDGAKKCGIKQKGKRSTYADMISAVAFIPDGVRLDQKASDVTTEQSYVTISNSKVLRIWPKLDTWSGSVTVILADEQQLPVSILSEIFTHAGLFVGIGDYRPEFGRFSVSHK